MILDRSGELPMADMMKTYKIQRFHRHNEGIISLYFDFPAPVPPGRFLEVWLPGLDEKPISASGMVDGLLEITICGVGPFTSAIMDCKVGDRLGLRGPFGNGFKLCENAVLVAGGMGIAPLRALAMTLVSQGIQPDLYIGAKTARDLIFHSWFEALEAKVVTDDGSAGHHGLVTHLLPKALPPKTVIYGCGPEPMLLALKAYAQSLGLDYQLAFERYMKCGIGICGQCCMDGTGIRVCTEGPVLGPAQLAGVTELGLPHRGPSGRR
jgi:dihydroorotate dehydrogenase electron transfer subunit